MNKERRIVARVVFQAIHERNQMRHSILIKTFLVALFALWAAAPFVMAGARDVTFFVISDSHYGLSPAGDETASALVDKMNRLPGAPYPVVVGGVAGKPRGVIHIGDITNDGRQPHWESQLEGLREKPSQMRCARGGISFTFETVMSSPDKVRLLEKAQAQQLSVRFSPRYQTGRRYRYPNETAFPIDPCDAAGGDRGNHRDGGKLAALARTSG